MVVSLEYRARSLGLSRFPSGVCDRRSQTQSVHSHPDLAELCCFDRDRTREEPRTGLTISRNEFCICSWAATLGGTGCRRVTRERIAGAPGGQFLNKTRTKAAKKRKPPRNPARKINCEFPAIRVLIIRQSREINYGISLERSGISRANQARVLFGLEFSGAPQLWRARELRGL